MKKIVKFSKLFIPCIIFSAILMILSIVGLFYKGINFGLDFRSGFIEKVRIAPVAFTLSYKGPKTVIVSLSSTGIDITSTAVDEDSEARSFPYSKYKDVASFMEDLKDFEGLTITLMEGVSPDVPFENFFVDSQVLPRLSQNDPPYRVHYIPKDTKIIGTDDVRHALEVASLPSEAVQQVGKEGDNVFQIRLPDDIVEDNGDQENSAPDIISEKLKIEQDNKKELEITEEISAEFENAISKLPIDNVAVGSKSSSDTDNEKVKEKNATVSNDEGSIATSSTVAETSMNTEASVNAGEIMLGEKQKEEVKQGDEDNREIENANKRLHLLIKNALAKAFGESNIVVISTDFVGSRFSASLARQAISLVLGALFLIFLYAMFRFRWDFALGGILALLHDTLAIFAFIVWTQMEFNSTSIAAILTIIGYSINDTVVIFDRIRENISLHPKENCTDILDISLSEVLGRTIITTLTTMLAALSLYIFTAGSMKDFAMCLIVGMFSGTYSSIYIASACINLFSRKKKGEEMFVAKAKPQGVSV